MRIPDTVVTSAPKYCSDLLPHLPLEIYDYIIDFLWYDPAALARCCLVCSALLAAAAHHLDHLGRLEISNRAAVALYARIFSAKENRLFSNTIESIVVREDPRSPFVHHFSISIPGCYLPEVTELYLNQLDWTITRPHVLFFDCLTFYSGVAELHLSSCRFKNASQLRRLISALPSLKALSLVRIDGSTLCDVPMTTVPRPTLNAANRIQDLTLFNPPQCTDLSAFTDSRVALRNSLAFCAQYSSVSQLSLDIVYLESLACVLQLLHNFPLLSDLAVHGSSNDMSVDVPEWQVLDIEHADVGALHLIRHRFVAFHLWGIPTIPALDLMKLVATSEACSKLESLAVVHKDSTGPVAKLPQAVMDTLRLAGAALRTFQFRWYCPLTECVPELDFAPSTLLEDVRVDLMMPPSPYTIERTLVPMVSSITSPLLKRLSISLIVADAGTSEAHQPFSGGDVLQSRGPEAVDDFHTILNALLFHDLPRNGVHITLMHQPNHTAAAEAIVQVKSRLDELFEPWLARNVLKLSMTLTLI
ncbi:hypothetical protein FOMPIDRAFT_88406 [Fomitopsis schrenkii]|uniref:F-box domain-containing protein n=1 Tax=Fomitopsis schrenkii TaxID=2126942 RepID=S8FQ65_FOMSC|nr:hypothetical protein FOMPIDRAFT_88406 [Fomitopsis schrenkii]